MKPITAINFSDENENLALFELYTKIKNSFQDVPIFVTFADYSPNPNESIDLINTFPKLNIRTYINRPNYNLKDIEDEIDEGYGYLSDGASMYPSIIIFHDIERMYEDITFNQIYEEFLHGHVAILEMLNIYVCCTIRK